MTSVTVNTYTHSVTYVTDNILKSLKDIIQSSGLNPLHLAEGWESYTKGLRAWMESKHLERVMLEIYNPTTNELVLRWDLDIAYGWSADDGRFWTDTDQLRYHIKKAGIAPADAKYDVILRTKEGRPDVAGWSSVQLRSTNGMARQSLGSTVEHSGLGASAAYWRTA
jgi:hypothetical protein